MNYSDKEPTPTNLHAPGIPPGPIPDLSSDEETEDEGMNFEMLLSKLFTQKIFSLHHLT